jgi:hypothetical protein
VALRWTRMSLLRARRESGTRAPDFAIFVLLSSVSGHIDSDPRRVRAKGKQSVNKRTDHG